MDIDSVSPRSQPFSQPFRIPSLWLPDPLYPMPANSRESSLTTLCMETSWPPKWSPSPGRETTPPFSYEDLFYPTLDTLDEIPTAPQTPYLRAQDQDQPTEWWKPSNDPPSSLPQSLATALYNARNTTTILHTLASLLTQLLASQTASGCAMQIPHDPLAHPAVNDAWILQVLLSLHPTLDLSPADLYALQRLCMHVCDVTADDLAALHEHDSVSPKRIARFGAKWDSFPEGAFDGVEGDASEEISIAGCLDFVAEFAEVWEGRKGIRVRGGTRRRLLAAAQGSDVDRAGDSAEVSRRLMERCRANVAHVLALLDRVAVELDAEMGTRANCTHWPAGCRMLGASDVGVRVARGYVDELIVEVERDREALVGWESSGIGAGSWSGDRDEDGRPGNGKLRRLLRRWMRLSEREGGWGWGLVMNADEIVSRIGAGRWVDLGGSGGGGEKRLGLRSW